MTKRNRWKNRRVASTEFVRGVSFGAPPHDWNLPDLIGHEFADPFEASSVAVAPRLAERLPSDDARFLEEVTPILMLNSGALYRAIGGDARAMVLTAATNDILALLHHVNHLDGRSAAQAARTLFEHAVTINDLYEHGGPNAPERYEAHQYVTRSIVAQRRWWLGLLPKKAQRREEARLDRMQRDADAALAQVQYPAAEFRRQWHVGNLFDRASRHGLSDGYDGYRILSAVIHGSAGGLGGIMRQIEGAPVHRIGGDLDLVTIAYTEGLWSWREFAKKLHKETARDEALALVWVADELLARIPSIRSSLVAIDKQLWPKTAPVAPMAMLAFYGQGRRLRWFLRDDQTGSAIPAHPPEGEVPGMGYLLEQAKIFNHEAFGGRPMTAIFPDLAVTPVSGAKPVPLSQIAVPVGHPAVHPRPRVAD